MTGQSHDNSSRRGGRDAGLAVNGMGTSQRSLTAPTGKAQSSSDDTRELQDVFARRPNVEDSQGLEGNMLNEEGDTGDNLPGAPRAPGEERASLSPQVKEAFQPTRKTSQAKCTYTSLPTSKAVLGTAGERDVGRSSSPRESQRPFRAAGQPGKTPTAGRVQKNGNGMLSQQKRSLLPPVLESLSGPVLPYRGRGSEGYIELAGDPSGDDHTDREGKRSGRGSGRRGAHPDEFCPFRYLLEEDPENTGKRLASWVRKIVTLTLLNVCNVTCMLIFEYILLRNVLAGSGQIQLYRQSLSLLLPAAAPRENFSSFR